MMTTGPGTMTVVRFLRRILFKWWRANRKTPRATRPQVPIVYTYRADDTWTCDELKARNSSVGTTVYCFWFNWKYRVSCVRVYSISMKNREYKKKKIGFLFQTCRRWITFTFSYSIFRETNAWHVKYSNDSKIGNTFYNRLIQYKL